MQFGFEKYCCFIPHRLDTFFVIMWFSMTTSFYFVSFVASVFAPDSIPSFALKIIPYTEILICLGALCGFGSSLFGSRKFTKVFSIILWISCVASVIVYIMTLYTLFVNSQDILDTSKNAIERMNEAIKESELRQKAYERTLNATEGEVSTIKPNHNTIDTEAAEILSKQILNYACIIYAVLAFAIQLYQLYFANIVHAYSKKMLYFAQYHKLYAQKQEMLDKQVEKIE